VKTIQISEVGGPEVMKVVSLPIPKPKPNEAVVKLKAVGVNYVDIYFREGAYKSPLPMVLGQEAGGVVTEVGSEVKTVKTGDRVAYRGVHGAYAEYAAVPAAALIKLPDGITEEQGAALMLQGMTAHYLLYSTYPVQPGETVLIHAAAGGVGLLMVQMAHFIGARVIATVGSEEKAKLAREAGANDVIVYTKTDFEAETKRLTDNQGVDVVYDSVGKATFDKGLNVLRPRGYMVNFGAASGPPAPLDLGVLTQKGSLFVTRPSLLHYAAKREELEERAHALFAMIKAHRLNLRIAHKYPLDEAIQAHRDLQGRKTTGKLLLIP